MDGLVLGIDVGTSACKAALFDENGRAIAQQSEAVPLHRPRQGWAEQHPDAWWRAVCAATGRLFGQDGIDGARIAAVGLAGQSWAAVAVDGKGNALCETPIWMDTRAQKECDEVKRRLGADSLFEISGNPLSPSYTLPKVLWYKENLPQVYEKADKILQSNGYIAMKMTGVASQDVSQGYGWGCFNMRSAGWDKALCAEMGVEPRLLPDIAPCHAVIGRVTKDAAAETGIPRGVPVVAGGLDAACGALGAGVLHPGQTQEQGGQAGGMSICTREYNTDPRLISSWHVAPGLRLLQGGTVGGGGVLRWFSEQFGAEAKNRVQQTDGGIFDALCACAGQSPAGARGAVFLPYMAGERSPLWNPGAKGVFYGLSYQTGYGDMVRACLEGVAFSLRHNLEVARLAGAAPKTLRAMGGAANSRLWTQIKCDVTGLPIEVPASDTATTLGAAVLAGVAAGFWPGFEKAARQTVKIERRHRPNASLGKVYDAGYNMYMEIYARLQPLMT